MTLKNKIKYFIKDLDFLRAYNSPFKAPRLKWYCGKVVLGTPYFYPRKWVKATPERAHQATLEHIKSTEEFNERNPQYTRRIKPYDEIFADKMKCSYSVSKKIGFDFIPLGWKTKFGSYRHEWNPRISFVFFKWQIAVTMVPQHDMHYWESWLYYTRETKHIAKTTEARLALCRKKAPQTWTKHTTIEEQTTDYYDLILKNKWQRK
jgi:hypothetical protein